MAAFVPPFKRIGHARGTATRGLRWCLLLAAAGLTLHMGATRSELASADAVERRLQHWQTLMREGHALDEIEQLARVNDFFNGARFLNDRDLWGTSDYWATPTEFLQYYAGDCEDFAIAKYFTLKAMGVAPDKLRITYVKVAGLPESHMVLAYYATPRAEPLILDNLDRRIRTAGERTDLRPVYSFNAETLWLARSRHEQEEMGHPGQLQRWREMLARLEPELRLALTAPTRTP